MTEFCGFDVPLWGDLPPFFVDGNSKITWDNGSYAKPKPNAFSLPHISTCPGSTPDCRASCYVHGLEANAKDIYRRYSLNAAALHRVLLLDRTALRAADILGEWIATYCTSFRWHVSGDVMHTRHAEWIAHVCESAPDINFWIYTRTFDAVPILRREPNLVVNISADATNYRDAQRCASMWGGRICYLTRDGSLPDDLPLGSVIFPDYELRGRNLAQPTEHTWWQSLTHERRKMVCPPDFFGQSEAHRCGPCTKCLVKS